MRSGLDHVRLTGRVRPDDRHPGMRLGAYPAPLQIEAPFAIPDTTQTSFRDDKLSELRRNRSRFYALSSTDPAFNRTRLKAEKLIFYSASGLHHLK
jgi:hypothetical protein